MANMQAKDSSVLFSLKELMSLEEERIKQEDLAREKAQAEVVREKLEAERRDREAAEAKVRAAEDARRLFEQRMREESARLEAIRQAELERARLDATNAAQLETLRRQQEHERELLRVQEQSGKKRLTRALVAIGVVATIGLAVGGFVLREQMRKAEAAEADVRAARAQLEENDAQQRAIEEKLRQSGQDKGAIEELQQKLRTLEIERERLQKAPVTPKSKQRITPPATKVEEKGCQKVCPRGDPLCVECR